MFWLVVAFVCVPSCLSPEFCGIYSCGLYSCFRIWLYICVFQINLLVLTFGFYLQLVPAHSFQNLNIIYGLKLYFCVNNLFKGVIGCDMHFYKLFELKCVLTVCVHNHPIMIKIHTVFYFYFVKPFPPFSYQAILRCLSVAVFPSTYFFAHFGILHKKMLDGSAKTRINSKNVQKKHMHAFE